MDRRKINDILFYSILLIPLRVLDNNLLSLAHKLDVYVYTYCLYANPQGQTRQKKRKENSIVKPFKNKFYSLIPYLKRNPKNFRTSDAIFALSSTWLHDGFHDCLNFMTPPPHTPPPPFIQLHALQSLALCACVSALPPPPPSNCISA